MIEIESYLKRDDQFIPIDEFTGLVEDDFYVEGALVLRVDGNEIMDLSHYDLIDQLWVYFMNHLEKVLSGAASVSSGTFPDQPLKIEVESVFKNAKLKIKLYDPQKTRQCIVETNEFLKVFCEAGEKFFEKMKVANPGDASDSEQFIAQLRKLRKIFVR